MRLGQGWQGLSKGLAAVTRRVKRKPQGPAWGWGWGILLGTQGPSSVNYWTEGCWEQPAEPECQGPQGWRSLISKVAKRPPEPEEAEGGGLPPDGPPSVLRHNGGPDSIQGFRYGSHTQVGGPLVPLVPDSPSAPLCGNGDDLSDPTSLPQFEALPVSFCSLLGRLNSPTGAVGSVSALGRGFPRE